MKAEIRRRASGAANRSAGRAGVDSCVIVLPRDSVREFVRTSHGKGLSRRSWLRTVDASLEPTRSVATGTGQRRTVSGDRRYLRVTDSRVSSVARVVASTPTISSRSRLTPRCGMSCRMGARSVSHAIVKRRHLDGVAIGSRFAANEIAAKRLAQEVLPFGEKL